MKVSYFGHSCVGVEVGNKNLLFDPFISSNKLAGKIDIKSIKADYIFISHGHEDHIADAVEIAKNTNAVVISNFEICNWLNKRGIDNFHPMNVGGKWIFDFGKVKCVNAVHSSSMPDGSYGGSAMGFLVSTGDSHFYYAGDTALTYDMKLIGDYRNLNFAFLPIGDNFTMSADNAIIASDFIKCDKIIGMHYDTFDYIIIDKKEAIEKFKQQDKSLILFEIGETKEI